MRIFFSPGCPREQDYSIVAMIHYLGYSVARTAEEPFDVAFMWDDATHITPPDSLLQLAESKLVLNLACTDISKEHVDELWYQVCGYRSIIDPFSYHGKAIQKFNANGQGGGELIDCPLPSQTPIDKDCIFQAYIETNVSGPQLEYRVPIVLGEMPIVFEVLKDNPEDVEEKKIKNQFKHSIIPKASTTIFSDHEIQQILLFCQKLGFDMGELDVLRCQKTARIYVIDANTTPTYFNMFNRYWRPEEKREAIQVVSECWARQLEKYKQYDGVL